MSRLPHSSRFRFELPVFAAGLAVVCWIGIGYLGSNPLASVFSLLIGACYVGGAFELWRYRQATGSLTQALGGLSNPPTRLEGWLAELHPTLRNAVRLRVEGARAPLPGPALTPYLVGLLVLLGMLGTLLGMTETLRGTGAALGSASDLAAIHAALVAPLAGLGFAFGTSIAGVASSAALGLLSALCRRERMQAADQLDAQLATSLRAFSAMHQKEQSFSLMQRQAELMPVLVDRLQALMGALEHQSNTLHERQAADQQAFHARMEAAHAQLAGSLGQMLQASATEGARAAGEALRPLMATTAAELARENAAMRETVTQAVHQQVEMLAQQFSANSADIAQAWRGAADEQRRTNESVVRDLQGTLTQFGTTFEQQSSALVNSLGARLDQTSAQLASGWSDALTRQETTHATLAGQHQQALENASQGFGQRANELVQGVEIALSGLQAALMARDEERLAHWTRTLDAANASLGEQWQQISTQNAQHLTATTSTLTQSLSQISAHNEQHLATTTDALKQSLEQISAQDQQRHAGWTSALTTATSTLTEHMQQTSARNEQHLNTCTTALTQSWEHTAAQHEQQRAAWTTALDATAATLAARWQEIAERSEQRYAAWNSALDATATRLEHDRAEAAKLDAARLDTWTGALHDTARQLNADWTHTAERAAERHQAICDTLSRTADDIAARTQSHASATIAEISQLVQAAGEAPKLAAEVVTELREKLADSLARDTATLEERSRLLATLATLLDAVNHASTEQRAAIDALVTTSSDLLERVGQRFAERIDIEAGKLDGAAAQITGGAVEIASLGEVFGNAVQLFGSSNEKLVEGLQRIEGALERSGTRNDEQLAYYVAQARELVDLSVLSQKQMIVELRYASQQQAVAGAEPA